jgi:hypothetical protein
MMDDMIFREGYVDNRLLEQLATVSSRDESVHRRERLGGMLNFYIVKRLEREVSVFAPYGLEKSKITGSQQV